MDETQDIPALQQKKKDKGTLSALVGIIVAAITVAAVGAMMWAIWWFATVKVAPFLADVFPIPLYAVAFLVLAFVVGVLLRPALETLGRGKKG